MKVTFRESLDFFENRNSRCPFSRILATSGNSVIMKGLTSSRERERERERGGKNYFHLLFVPFRLLSNSFFEELSTMVSRNLRNLLYELFTLLSNLYFDERETESATWSKLIYFETYFLNQYFLLKHIFFTARNF